jgi:hypothetical protein
MFVVALLVMGAILLFSRNQGSAGSFPEATDDLVNVGIVSETDERVTDRVLGILRANFGRDFDYRCTVLCGVWVRPQDAARTITLLTDDSKQ